MKQLLDDDQRGQVGIGTLIVFIAMVLVAAIAAGVLINTAGFLQNQAEDTGTESTEQVADNLNVITEVGTVNYDDNINEIRVGVQPAAGADDVNLAELTVQYVSDGEFENLVVGADTQGQTLDGDQAGGDTDPSSVYLTTDSQATYVVDLVTAENDGDLVMTDSSDRYELVVPLGITADSWGTTSTETDDGLSCESCSSGITGVDSGDILSVDTNNNIVSIDDATTTNGVDDFKISDPDKGFVEWTGADGTNLDSDTIDYTYSDYPGNDQDTLQPLDEGEEVELTITTEVGSQTVAFLQVPDSLSGEDTGTTVNL